LKKDKWEKIQNKTVLPPMCIFIDEIHRTTGAVQDQMLKLLESKDGVFIDRNGDYFDFGNVCIIIATNDPGRLREAFKTRFTFIYINKPSVANVVKILQLSNKNFDEQACLKIANLTHTIRQALDFSKMVSMSMQRSENSLMDAIDTIRKRFGIYSNGLTERALFVLKAVATSGDDGCSRKTLFAMVPDLQEIEFEEMILPQLVSAEKDHLISIRNRHRITKAGLQAIEECKAENNE
jgi:Holliday junction resolvasome RuvABC ATP-dependent DNA helicase subunit